jgi:transposase
MSPTLSSSRPVLTRLMKRDPDARVRRRAHALLLVAEGRPLSHIARLFRTAPHRVRAWRTRFLAGGRAGLLDAPRPGRPPKLSPVALHFLEEALGHSPHDYGLLSTVWTIRDLGALLVHQHGVQVSTATLHHALWHLGYRHRRPRHDLKHRQDLQAVAGTRQVLDWLKKMHRTSWRGSTGLCGRMRSPPPSSAGKGLAETGPAGESARRRGRP